MKTLNNKLEKFFEQNIFGAIIGGGLLFVAAYTFICVMLVI